MSLNTIQCFNMDNLPFTKYIDSIFNLNILSKCSKNTREGPEIYTTNCCRAVYAGNIAQHFLKILYYTEKSLSGAWFCELLSDWSKTLFGSQDLLSSHKVKKSVLSDVPRLGHKMRGIA